MDYKKLSIVLAIIIILVVAFFLAREFLFKIGEKNGKQPSGTTGKNQTTSGGNIGGIFDEPPQDFKPPSLPP